MERVKRLVGFEVDRRASVTRRCCRREAHTAPRAFPRAYAQSELVVVVDFVLVVDVYPFAVARHDCRIQYAVHLALDLTC